MSMSVWSEIRRRGARAIRLVVVLLLLPLVLGSLCDKKKIPTDVDCSKVENCLHLKCWNDKTCQALTEKFPPGGCKPGQVKDPKSLECRDCTSADCDGVPGFCCVSSACSDSIACGMYLCRELGSQCGGVTGATCGYHDLDGDDAWGDCDEAPNDPCCVCKIAVGCSDSPCKRGQFVSGNGCKECGPDDCDQLPCMGYRGCPTNCPPGKYFDGVTCRPCEGPEGSEMNALIPACDFSAKDAGAGATSDAGDDAGDDNADDGGGDGGKGKGKGAGTGGGTTGETPPVSTPVTNTPLTCPGAPTDGLIVFHEVVAATKDEKAKEDWAVAPGPVLGDPPKNPSDPKQSVDMGDGKVHEVVGEDVSAKKNTPLEVCDTLSKISAQEQKSSAPVSVPTSFDYCGKHYDCPPPKPFQYTPVVKAVSMGGTGAVLIAGGVKAIGAGAGVVAGLGGGVLVLVGGTLVYFAWRNYWHRNDPPFDPVQSLLGGVHTLVEKKLFEKQTGEYTTEELKELGLEYKKYKDLTPAERADLNAEMEKEGVNKVKYHEMMKWMAEQEKAGRAVW